MTVRNPPAVVENVWSDAQRVSETAMKKEQAHVDQTISALINNHLGSGVLPTSLVQNVLFDSDILSADQIALVAANIFDGTGVQVTTQPSDINLGNQLEIELKNSNARGRKSVKVAVIGLGFDDSVQMERLYFYKNEVQVTSKHYKKILALFFNDFKGNSNCSTSLGGQIIVREARSFQISRDDVMVAQDVEPDLFWRDFKKPDNVSSLFQILQTGIGPEYSIDSLNINTTGRSNKRLEANDVSTQIGQKFKARTNNIQKITLLLAVDSLTDVSDDHIFDWAGDIVVSIYPLQSSVSCITDIVPNLAIDFDPATVPLAQVSFNMQSLKDAGYFLDNILQPVDFVFSNTKIGVPDGISVDSYYILTIRRSGSASQNAIQVGVGNDRLDDSVESLFSGTVWVDVPEEDLWFQVWTDAVKIADGAGYDNGNGMYLPKTTIDSSTGATIDNEVGGYSFGDTGQNTLNIAVLQAVLKQQNVTSDERSGNPLVSEQLYIPKLSLISQSELSDLQDVSEPLIIGAIKDTNPKNNPSLSKVQDTPGLVNASSFCVINPDADLLSLNLVGSKLIPNTEKSFAYKIAKVTKCTNLYGNPTGTGEITSTDVDFITSLIGESLFSNSTTQKIYDGYFSTIQLLQSDLDGDGYITSSDADLMTQYLNKEIATFPIGFSFNSLCLEVEELFGRYDGYFCKTSDGYLDGYGNLIAKFSDLTEYQIEADGYLVDPTITVDTAFSAVPFIPVNYNIIFEPFWRPEAISATSETKFVPASFTYPDKPIDYCATIDMPLCEDINENPPVVDPGRNDIYIPNNLIIDKGQLLKTDGSFYKTDVEVGIVEITLPDEPLDNISFNLVDIFMAEQANGKTIKGFPAMKYADCSFVQKGDFDLNRIRLSVAIQSIDKQLDGYDADMGFSITVDELLGIYLDSSTGILTISAFNLAEDNVYKNLSTKLIVTAYLKKAGWNNTTLAVSGSQVLGLIT